MQLLIDDRPIPAPDLARPTLAELIHDVRRHHLNDRIVVGVELDGRPLVDQELMQALQQPLAGDEQVRLESAAAGDVVGAALQTIADQLEQAAESIEPLADAFARRTTPAEADQLCRFLDIWRSAQQALTEAGNLLGRDLSDLTVTGGPVREQLTELVRGLRELRDAFGARDGRHVADLLRYEWTELSRRWSAIINEIIRQVAA